MQINLTSVYNIFFTAFLLSVFPVSSVIAQSQPFPFKQFPLPQDLPSVYSMYEDHDGYIWLGTVEGLYRFDGIHYTHYAGKENNDGLGRELITYILEDAAEQLWIGARTGLYRYSSQKKDFEKFSFADEVYPYYVHQESDSSFLVHCLKGIYFFFPKNNRWEKLDVDVEDKNIHAALRGSKNDVWIGTDEYVRKYNIATKTFQDFPLIIPARFEGKERLAVHALYLDSREQLWINTWFKGMIRLDTHTGKSVYVDTIRQGQDPYLLYIFNPSITEDPEGNVWLSSPNAGINIYHPKTGEITHIVKGEDYGFGLIGNGLTLMMDHAKNIWVKSDRALHYLSRSSPVPQLLTDENNLIPEALFMKFLTSDVMLMGSYNGLYTIDIRSKKVTKWNNLIQLSAIPNAEIQMISDVLQSGRNTLWLTSPQGLRKMQYETGENNVPAFQYQNLYKTKEGFWASRLVPVNDTLMLVKGRSNTHTFALFNMKSGNFDYHELPDSMPINQVAEFNHDTLLFGIRNQGLYFFDIRTSSFTLIPWKFTDEKIKIEKPVFLNIQLLENKTYAISTENYGAILFDPSTRVFQLLQIAALANTNIVYDVAEDDQYNLWIQASSQLLFYETTTQNLSKTNLSNSFKGYNPSYFIHEGKQLYASFEGGLYRISLDQLFDKPQKLKLYLQNIKAQDRSLNWAEHDQIRLNYSDNFLTYDFVGLDYANPQGIRYWYKIPEISQEWVSLDNHTSISLGRMSPGQYHFSVKASNSAGWWSDEVHAPVIRITPPFWSTWWFVALVAAFFAGVIGYLLRVKRMKAESELKLRNKIAKDLHDDIGSTLSGIRIFSGIATDLASGHEELEPLLQKISDKSDTMMQSMSDIVWSINPRYDSLHDMVIRLKQYMNEVLEIQNIEVHFSSDVDLKNIRLDLQHRKEIFLSLKEIINNVAKHAKCQNLNFGITKQKGDLIFRITDDGIGMDENHIVPGNGLINIRDRIHQIGGSIIQKSSPGMGTSYEIRVGVV